MSNPRYTPILKWKAGEQKALRNLTEDQKNRIIPLVEFYDQPEPTTVINDLKSCFGNPVYIDTIDVDQGDRESLVLLLEAANQHGLAVYPVLYFTDFSDVADRMRDLASRILVRIPVPEDIEGPDHATIFSRLVEWHKKDINREVTLDIILDLNVISNRHHANLLYAQLRDVLHEHVAANNIWQRVILAMTSFPDNISPISAGESAFFDRFDITVFKKVYGNSQPIQHLLMFADYGVTRFTDTELDFSKMRYGPLPKARYTTADYYWVLKGEKDRRNNIWIKDHRAIAQEIHSSTHYYGEDFSFGDLEIKERALGLKGPGNNTDWVAINANHHIVVVLEELASFFGS